MRLERLNPGNVVMAATQTISKAIHDGKWLILNLAAGHTVTLPPAVGSGATFYFFESLAHAGQTTTIKVANSNDIMQGAIAVTGTTSGTFGTAANSDAVVANGTTTGGALAGGWIEIVDVLANMWHVRGVLNGSGTAATPFQSIV